LADKIQPRKPRMGCLYFFLIFVVVSVIDVRLLTNACFSQLEYKKTVNITNKVPNLFPVFVVSSSGKSGDLIPAIVFYENLQKYLKAHPDYSYTVPTDKVEQLNKYLKKYNYDSGFGVGRFSVTTNNGKQLFRVDGTWDDDRVNIGWYEATPKTFTPKRYCWYFAPGYSVVYLVLITIVNVIMSLLFYGLLQIYYYHQRKRNQPHIAADTIPHSKSES